MTLPPWKLSHYFKQIFLPVLNFHCSFHFSFDTYLSSPLIKTVFLFDHIFLARTAFTILVFLTVPSTVPWHWKRPIKYLSHWIAILNNSNWGVFLFCFLLFLLTSVTISMNYLSPWERESFCEKQKWRYTLGQKTQLLLTIRITVLLYSTMSIHISIYLYQSMYLSIYRKGGKERREEGEGRGHGEDRNKLTLSWTWHPMACLPLEGGGLGTEWKFRV